MLCAGVDNTILSGCHGDSGGPYVCLNAGKRTYTLHGAVSWGSSRCDSKQLYSVFARVTQFRAWIKQHTGIGGGGLQHASCFGYNCTWLVGLNEMKLVSYGQRKIPFF